MNGARLSKLSVYGLNYKDRRAAALKWLAKNGNPYAEILFDPKATFAMRLGVYGVPETFIIDTKAVIRYRRVGPISPELWRDELKPKILQLLAEARHVT